MEFNSQRFTHLADLAWIWAAQFLPRLAAAVLILGVGFVAARWLSRAVNAALARAPHVDRTLHPVLVSVVRYAVLVLVAIVALRQIGIETTSLLAVVGAAGLAIGLALQGTLSNIAAGIMLLWLRPFHVGDFIEVAGRSGAVERAIVEAIKRALEALGEKFKPSQIVRQTPPDSDPSRYLERREPVHTA